jgi:hypothetical protein
MNTNEASLGRTTVQTYSSREKRAFDGVLFSMECTARWLENGCDPMQAAAEIRLAMAELRNCIADCESAGGAGPQSSPPNGAIGEREAFEAWGNETFNYGFQPETWCDGAGPVAREAQYTHEGTQMAWEG